MNPLSITLEVEQYNAIDTLSKSLDVSKSEVVRRIYNNSIFLYDLLSNFGLKTDPDDFTWTKIEKLNTFMEALKTANNEK